MADDFVTLHISANDYPAALSWHLVQWCLDHGADEWTVQWVLVEGEPDPADDFEAVMRPHHIGRADRGMMTTYDDAFIHSTDLWRSNAESIASLQEFLPDGLFTYQVGKKGWLEDPIFYRGGEMILGVVSHEGYGQLRITEQERQELEKAELRYHIHK